MSKKAGITVRSSRTFRFRLQTLLLVTAMFAIVAGWLVDRRSLDERLRQAQRDSQNYNDQVATLQRQLSEHYQAIAVHYWWVSADEFIEMLTTTSDESKFLEMAPSLANSDEPVFRDAIEQLTALLDSPEERTKRRSVIAIRFLQERAPNRMAESASSIVAMAIPLFEDDSRSDVAAEAISMVQSFGPAASGAIDALTKKMADDSDYWAPAAAIAAAEINSNIDISTRLVELVRMKHPCWYEAAFYMSRYVDHATARSVVTEVLNGAKTQAEREAAIQVLNQIPPRTVHHLSCPELFKDVTTAGGTSARNHHEGHE